MVACAIMQQRLRRNCQNLTLFHTEKNILHLKKKDRRVTVNHADLTFWSLSQQALTFDLNLTNSI